IIVVPILSDFKPDTIHHLVNHSEARLLFTDEHIWENLDPAAMDALEGVFNLSDFSLLISRHAGLTSAREHLNELFGRMFPERFTPADLKVYDESDSDAVALINYTSGSTGFSKGVMLTYRNLWSNIQFTIDNLQFLNPGDGIVCMLPLAHMYGLVVDLLHTFVKGCHIHFLTRTPSPRVIMDAFARVRPKLIVSVPLIIEKIIKTRVFPLLEKPMMKLMLHVPFVDDHLLNRIRQQLTQTFGGNLQEMIIGGAGLNREVADFLRRIGFPFTVGYGMTECAPLISYAPWTEARPGSCGRVVTRMTARIIAPDADGAGVIFVKGDNVMKGYFKNPEATAEAIDGAGWLCTGDIGTIDSDGFIYLRGRDKNMLLGPSGQNIYPEEIEQVLNNLPYVNESLIVSDADHRLVALIHPDYDLALKSGLDEAALKAAMDANLVQLNKDVPAYSRVSSYRLMAEEFEKTPKRSIKRFLYQA
ncbi:MAG: AMP-binding protein, partial [Paramuribaculum sp.]|nr:AMP-binding protein [Paramuribaculum sp.]